jgi:uncharacterized protein (DUF983 family)
VPFALWAALSTDWPLWLHAIIWTFVILGLTIGLLRPAKGLMIALQFRHRGADFEAAQPRGDPAENGRP